jgi:periplasmic protein TonB
MRKVISLHRCATLGVSCLIHVVLVGAAIAIGRDLVAPKVPAVLMADLTLIESPRLVEAPAPGPPAPPRPKPEKLTLPKPIATPMPAPASEPEPVETRAPLPPPPVAEPSPAVREPATPSAPAMSFEAAGGSSAVDLPVEAGRGGSNAHAPAPPPKSVAAIPADGITQTAIPRGGYQVRPSYPSSARRLGIQGMTTLRVYIAADGRVTEVLIQESAGHPDLDSAAAEAVKRWRFEPARRGAEAVGVWVLLPVEFRLR